MTDLLEMWVFPRLQMLATSWLEVPIAPRRTDADVDVGGVLRY
jgi:hypothetical protein